MIKSKDDRLERQNISRDQRAQRRKSPIRFLSDTHFLQRFKLTRNAYRHLCIMLEENGELKPSENLSIDNKVLRALVFYSTGRYQKVVGNIFLSINEIKKCVEDVTKAINHPNVVDQLIKFPNTKLDRDEVVQDFYKKYKFPGVLGCIDCCHFKIARPNKEEEHIYCRGVNIYSLKVQIVTDSNHKVMSAESKFGGAILNEIVWENSRANTYMENLHKNGEAVWILGDLEYVIQPWLLTPYPDPVETNTDKLYNDLHDEILAVTKDTFRLIKQRWLCLSDDMPLNYNPVVCSQIVIACIALHNLALEFSVPIPGLPEPESTIIVEDENSDDDSDEDSDEEDLSLPELGRILRDGVAKRIEDVQSAQE